MFDVSDLYNLDEVKTCNMVVKLIRWREVKMFIKSWFYRVKFKKPFSFDVFYCGVACT
jgi:hypothetical protein